MYRLKCHIWFNFKCAVFLNVTLYSLVHIWYCLSAFTFCSEEGACGCLKKNCCQTTRDHIPEDTSLHIHHPDLTVWRA